MTVATDRGAAKASDPALSASAINATAPMREGQHAKARRNEFRGAMAVIGLSDGLVAVRVGSAGPNRLGSSIFKRTDRLSVSWSEGK